MKEMITIYEKGTYNRVKGIPDKIVPPHTSMEDADRMAKEYWKEHGGRKDWEAVLHIDPEIYF